MQTNVVIRSGKRKFTELGVLAELSPRSAERGRELERKERKRAKPVDRMMCFSH